MDLRDRKVNTGVVAGVAACLVLLVLAGCSVSEPVRPAYLSGESQLVGGGVKIEWKAPEPGTAYLVEKRTNKLIQTATLDTGESFKFVIESPVDAQDLESLIGIGVSKAEFLLYFKPTGKEKTTP